MKTFVVLSALVLAVCVVTSQGKSFRKSNANTNINTNVNNNFNRDFLSSYLNSMLNQQERKGKTVDGASLVSRAVLLPDITAQQEEGQQTADEFQSPVDAESTDDTSSFDESAFGPQEDEESQDDFLTVIPASQLKFFQALAAKTQMQQ